MEACLQSIPLDRCSYQLFSTWKNAAMQRWWLWIGPNSIDRVITAIALWWPPFPLIYTVSIHQFFSLLAGLQSQRKWGFCCAAFYTTLELNFLPKTFLLNTLSKYLIDQQSATFTNKYYIRMRMNWVCGGFRHLIGFFWSAEYQFFIVIILHIAPIEPIYIDLTDHSGHLFIKSSIFINQQRLKTCLTVRSFCPSHLWNYSLLIHWWKLSRLCKNVC